jgi:hypothetical protein
VPHKLEEAVRGKVVLVQAALVLGLPAGTRLKACLPLLDPGPELLLEPVQWLVSCPREEVVARGWQEAGNDTHELARQVRQVGLAEDALVLVAGLRDLAE